MCENGTVYHSQLETVKKTHSLFSPRKELRPYYNND